MSHLLQFRRRSAAALVSTFGGVADLLFILLCLRFQVASILFAGTLPFPTALLIAGGMTLGFWKQCPALFAFSLAVPLLDGLGEDALIGCPAPICLVFSAIWTGIAARRVWDYVAKRRRSEDCPKPRIDEADFDDSPSTDALTSKLVLQLLRFATAVLIGSVLVSYAWMIWTHRGSNQLFAEFVSRPIQAYGDPLYFITSAFVWLQGLFYFREICLTGRSPTSIVSDGLIGKGGVGLWVHPLFAVYAATLSIFFLIQYFFHVPEGWADAGFQSPYEDISSFGSIAAAVFIFQLATWKQSSWHSLPSNILGCGWLLFMVIASWSRAAWLAALVFILVTAMLHLRHMFTITLLVVLFGLLSLINANLDKPIWNSNIYLARFASLVRFEDPGNKNNGRFHLYKKAEHMIGDYPWLGAGIGSFYLTSVAYAEPNDPYWRAKIPDFAHNVVLQIAAEEGIPIALMFVSLTALVLCRGFYVHREKRSPTRLNTCLLGVSLALGCYLQTQMTANSLNVYPSNQFFFWFLLAVILVISDTKEGSLVSFTVH